MTIVYGALFALSLIMPVGYFWSAQKKQNEVWLCSLYVCICIVNLGYLLLSLSKTVAFALFANKIAYLGQAFLMPCMFMLISKLCGYTYPKWARIWMVVLAAAMFGLVATTGYLDWYYKSATLTYADGAAKLVKEYGVLHPLYLFYVLGYFVAMIIVIVTSLKRKKMASQKVAGLMVVVVLGNIGMWLVEKLVTLNFEFLSVSYVMSGFIFFFIYWIMQDYVHIRDISAAETVDGRTPIIVVDSLTRAQKIERILAMLPEGKHLTARQIEMLEGILDGKSRKQIAAELHLSENTVKMHMSLLYDNLGVSGKDEIYGMLQSYREN